MAGVVIMQGVFAAGEKAKAAHSATGTYSSVNGICVVVEGGTNKLSPCYCIEAFVSVNRDYEASSDAAYDETKALLKEDLSDLLTNVSTESKHYGQIHQDIQNLTGGMSFVVSSFRTQSKTCKTTMSIKFSSLENNLLKAQELVEDIINNTKLDDYKRIYEKISEINVGLEMNIAQRGHVVGLTRASGYFDESKYLLDAINGIGYLDFIHDLYVNFEDKKEEVSKKLNELLPIIFNKSRFSFD